MHEIPPLPRNHAPVLVAARIALGDHHLRTPNKTVVLQWQQSDWASFAA
jgi:hypothetical protein